MRIKAILKYALLSPSVRELCERVGPAVWRLSPEIRWRLCRENQFKRLPGAKTLAYGKREAVRPPPLQPAPSFGHLLASRPYVLNRPEVTEISDVWLVGRHATPVTRQGRVLLSAYRNQPRILGLEPNEDLIEFVRSGAWRTARPQPVHGAICSLVNRLDINYGHWLNELCGQLQGVFHYASHTGVLPAILIRRDGPAFMRESLTLLGIPGEAILDWAPEDGPVLAEKLILPTIPGIRVAYSPASLRWLRSRFLKGAGIDEAGLEAGKRIYVPRKPGGWRCVVNHDEVVRHLAAQGFEIVAPERLTFKQQVELFAQARCIVGLHGSGLNNILFAPHAALVELIGSYADGTWYSVATGMGQRYRYLRCQPEGENAIVDLKQLDRCLCDLG